MYTMWELGFWTEQQAQSHLKLMAEIKLSQNYATDMDPRYGL